MTPVIICLGSNHPQAREKLASAIAVLRELLTHPRTTPVYTTPAEGSRAIGLYHNAIVAGHTTLPLHQLITRLKHLETLAGRPPHHTLETETIIPLDLDLVTYGSILLRPAQSRTKYYLTGLPLLPPEE